MNVDPKFEPIDTEKVLANLERSDGVSDQPSLELKELHESIKTKTKQIDTLKNDLLRKLTDNLDLNKRQDIVAKECADAAEKCENHTNGKIGNVEQFLFAKLSTVFSLTNFQLSCTVLHY